MSLHVENDYGSSQFGSNQVGLIDLSKFGNGGFSSNLKNEQTFLEKDNHTLLSSIIVDQEFNNLLGIIQEKEKVKKNLRIYKIH